MKNIILFGGSFDPIHNGHIEMAKRASTFLDAEVIFIPAVISVWKERSADFIHKVNMINLAIKDYPFLKVSLYESTTGKDVNYSIDTIKYFKTVYPNDNLYMLIGEDQVKEFHRWRDAEEISKLVNIIFFERPDYEDVNGNVSRFNMIIIDEYKTSAASTNIRDLVDVDTPLEVLEYIASNNLYYMEKIRPLISEKRMSHSLEVAKLCYKIAYKSNKINPNKAYVAGLLHDIGKEIEAAEVVKIMEEHYPEYISLPRFSYHQFVGEYIAKTVFGIKDEEVLEAIRYHATGNANMSDLGKIVYASDKIEPTRGFDSSDLIAACYENYENGFIVVLEANKEYLLVTKKDINNALTAKCFAQYLK